MHIEFPRLDYYIKDLDQMRVKSWAMINEMEKDILNPLMPFMMHQEFYQKIMEWHGLMETSTRLLGEIGVEMSRIQRMIDEMGSPQP